jgi:uncharacterized OsmC-like protein
MALSILQGRIPRFRPCTFGSSTLDDSAPWKPVVGSVAACLTNGIALNAHRHGIDLEGLEVKVSCDVDPSVLFEVREPQEHTSCMPKISSEVRVKGDLSEEQVETIQRLVHHSAGYYDRQPAPVSTRNRSWHALPAARASAHPSANSGSARRLANRGSVSISGYAQ